MAARYWTCCGACKSEYAGSLAVVFFVTSVFLVFGWMGKIGREEKREREKETGGRFKEKEESSG